MRVRAVLVLLVLCLLGSVSLGGCRAARPQRYQAQSFAYFDTVTTVIGYAESKEAFDREAAAIFAELAEYHQLFDIYHAYEGIENLYTVNEVKDGRHQTVTVDARVIELLLFAKEMYGKTSGTLNVGMGSVLSIWHTHRTAAGERPDAATLPTEAELAAAAAHTSLEALVIDREHNTVTLTDPLVTLDVGAVAKGFATERVAASMAARGLSHYVLNVGGNVRAVGSKADGSPWLAGIENPEDTSADYLATLELTHHALVTSGSYQRYYVVDGQRYHHIIHPDTLMPATGLLSVSVVCPDSGMGDALSTALFCLTVEEGKALVESLEDIEAAWVAEDGTRITSSGWEQYVKQ